MKHSELPWVVDDTNMQLIAELNSDAETYFYLADCDVFPAAETDGLPEANAQFIVKACNNHYKLLKTLKDLVNEPANYTEKAAWEIINRMESQDD